jgi:outer membrane protein assembly factor BamB
MTDVTFGRQMGYAARGDRRVCEFAERFRRAAEGSFLAAVSTKDGKIAWKTPRKEAVTWTTPVIVESGQQQVLIVPAMESIVAYDPRGGKELWRTAGLDSNSVHTPVFGHGMVYVTAGFPKKIIMALRLDPAKGQERIAWKYDKGTGYNRNQANCASRAAMAWGVVSGGGAQAGAPVARAGLSTARSDAAHLRGGLVEQKRDNGS